MYALARSAEALSPFAMRLPGRLAAPAHWAIPDMVTHTFPDLLVNVRRCAEASASSVEHEYFATRALLSPKNSVVNEVNAFLMQELLTGGCLEQVYHSRDTIKGGTDADYGHYPLEFLHSLQPNGLPPHILTLTPGAVIILLRNLDTQAGICNGARAIVKACHPRVLDVVLLTGRAKGMRIYIPRIELAPQNPELPFVLSRRQFPVRLAFCMTINKAQGQTFQQLGLILPESVFSHGQLYVALSRVGGFQKARVYVQPQDTQGPMLGDGRVGDGTYTDNIVWPEVLGRETPGPVEDTCGAHRLDLEEEAFAPGCSHAPCDTYAEDTAVSAAAAAALQAAAKDPLTEADLDCARDFAGLAPDVDSSSMGHASATPCTPAASSWELPPKAPASFVPVAHPEGAEEPRYPLLFEKQAAMRCGRHALNNALGGEVTFQNSDLTAACDVVIAESWIPDDNGQLSDPQDRADHELANGWYSEAVLAMTLRRTMQYQLLLLPLRDNPNILEDPTVAGAIVNLHNAHWVALKRVDGNIWLLDSCRRPVQLPYEEYLAFVRSNKYSYPVQRL